MDIKRAQYMKCSLCSGTAYWLTTAADRDYYRCGGCRSVLLHPQFFLSSEQEKARYETHQNCTDDPRYQKFVSPIVDAIKERFGNQAIGLDFGAGTGPVITKMLSDAGYDMALYDPFFHDNPKALNQQYDFIACCEVIEHFHQPAKEFRLLRSLLKAGGVLYCKTELVSESTDFENWYYKNDPTHVFFYNQKAFAQICEDTAFSNVQIDGRLIILEV